MCVCVCPSYLRRRVHTQGDICMYRERLLHQVKQRRERERERLCATRDTELLNLETLYRRVWERYSSSPHIYIQRRASASARAIYPLHFTSASKLIVVLHRAPLLRIYIYSRSYRVQPKSAFALDFVFTSRALILFFFCFFIL